jgi:hypothetical protein
MGFYKNEKLYDHYTAQGMMLMQLHDPQLNFAGYAYPGDAQPAHVEDNGYIVAKSGTIWGLSVNKGQIIKDTGSAFVAENIEIQFKSYDQFPNPKNFLALKQNKTNDVSSSLSSIPEKIIQGENNTTGRIVYYAGAKTRLYYLFKDGWNGSAYPQYIGYYQYDDNTWGTPVNYVNLSSYNDDHDYPAMCVTQNGYIIIVTTNRDYSDFHIYKSNNIEDIGNDSTDWIDKKDGWSFSGNLDYPSVLRCKDKIIITVRGGDQHRRTAFVSSDEGETWIKNTLLVSDDSQHWCYGSMANSTSENGVFQIITFENNEDTGDGNANNNPKWGVIWTDDGVNWGNMEYYASNKQRGWSKDISGDNNITYSEFETYCMVIDDPWGNDTDGYPTNGIQDMFTTLNGSFVVIQNDGFQDSSGTTSSSKDNLRISIYDINTLSWNHTLVPMSDLQDDTNFYPSIGIPSGYNPDEMDIIIGQNDGSYKQLYRYKYFNGNIEFVEDLTGYGSSNLRMADKSYGFFENQGIVIFTCDDNTGDGNLNFIMFDKNMR